MTTTPLQSLKEILKDDATALGRAVEGTTDDTVFNGTTRAEKDASKVVAALLSGEKPATKTIQEKTERAVAHILDVSPEVMTDHAHQALKTNIFNLSDSDDIIIIDVEPIPTEVEEVTEVHFNVPDSPTYPPVLSPHRKVVSKVKSVTGKTVLGAKTYASKLKSGLRGFAEGWASEDE